MAQRHRNCPIDFSALLRKLVKANDKVWAQVPEGVAELDEIINQVLDQIFANHLLNGTPEEKERVIRAARRRYAPHKEIGEPEIG